MSLHVSRLSGCYESLEGGNTGDAIVDFSGAVAESISLETEAFYKEPEKEEHLFEDLLKVFDRGGLISCSIKVCPAVPPVSPIGSEVEVVEGVGRLVDWSTASSVGRSVGQSGD